VLEGTHEYCVVDGNLESDAAGVTLAALDGQERAVLAVTVMPGPQVATAIEISRAVRKARPRVPIVWGGYFPTLYPGSAINAPYVDYVSRGQGEDTLLELVASLEDAGPPAASRTTAAGASACDPQAIRHIRGLTWKDRGETVHNPDRSFRAPNDYPHLPYHRLRQIDRYFQASFLGHRTGVHQAAIGCRYRCSFCGVVSMFHGQTILQGVERLAEALTTLRDDYGADALQFYDHNFFDREATSIPILEVLARFRMPWWCYARADTLAKFSKSTWELLRRSRLTMTYIGAEAASDEVLRGMRKGTKVEQTFEVAARCREYGVIPEFSFVLGGPEDPEGEIERTFEFIKRLKKIHPECEVILYFYSPTPQRDRASARRDRDTAQLPQLDTYGPGGPSLPTTPEGWTQPEWIDYVCHQDAPWLSPEMRGRVKDFAKVLYSRFPTLQDHSTPLWAKRLLSGVATWRYATGRYGKPWELDLARRFIRIREPQRVSI
jgi:radical SAM superfamily enzyme YgiQ (UPF0313 family)